MKMKNKRSSEREGECESITSRAVDVISNRQGKPAVITDATTNDLYAPALASACVLSAPSTVISDDTVIHTLRGAGSAVREQSLANK